MLQILNSWGAWEALSVERLALDFGSGHDLAVREIEPRVELCADSVKPAWDSLPLSLSVTPLLVLARLLSLSK